MSNSPRSRTTRYVVAVVAVLTATLLRRLLEGPLGTQSAFVFYYAAVAVATWYGGTGPGLAAMCLGLMAGDLFFQEPPLSLGPSDIEDVAASCSYLFTCVAIIIFSRASHAAYQHETLLATQALNRELARQAEQLAEMDARKNDFLAMLGHELRNPLAGILNGVEVLRLTNACRPDAEEMQAIIERQAGHMARLIDDLLDVSRISRGKIRLQKHSVDLVQIVRDTAESYRQRMAESGQNLRMELPAEALWVFGDPTRSAQIIGNLLANAHKFTDSGGRIEARLTADLEARQATVAIRDTGVGLEPGMVARIFEPFSQADATLERSRGGLGLGLALAKGLAEMHGGHLSGSSEGVGRGCEFRFRLPLVEKPQGAAACLPRAATAIQPHRVLLVEDRRDAAAPVQKMLQLLGQEVRLAPDGASALAEAHEFHPQIVLCDIGLPDINGYVVAGRLRRDPQCCAAYLVAVTGYGQEEDRRRAAEAGFDFHLTKPVAKTQLEELLRDLPKFASISSAEA